MAGVSIEIGGQACDVPQGITAIQALWYCGQRPIRGVGCLGGSCGGCVFSYSIGGQPTPQTGLACQTLIEEGMRFHFAPQPLKPGPSYQLSDLAASREQIGQFFPEAKRCTNCMACIWVCPQQIDARAMVRRATSGDLADVADRFTTCILCGLCEAVCDVGIAPFRVGLFAHRAVARSLEPPGRLLDQLAKIQDGHYGGEWRKLLAEAARAGES